MRTLKRSSKRGDYVEE